MRPLALLGLCLLLGCAPYLVTDFDGGPDGIGAGDGVGAGSDGMGPGDGGLDLGPAVDGALPPPQDLTLGDGPRRPVDLARADGAPPAPGGPTRYLAGPRHSPLSSSVVARLRAVVAATPGRRGVFAKVGDSITVNTGFLHCFAGNDVRLDKWGNLSPTRDAFVAIPADGQRSSFNRVSLAAGVGWSAAQPVAGNPTPVDQELAAVRPAFAVVMLGTNDTYAQGVIPFERNLRRVADALLARGVVPLLSTIPPRGDRADANALVPEMNAIVRAVAQSRQVPLMDYHQALLPLPGFGLAGDGVHPASYSDGAGTHSCWLSAAALTKGNNQRNLITLEALDRARRFLVDQPGAPAEPAPPPVAGQGTFGDPFVVDHWPFVDDRDTAKSGSRVARFYSCGPQDEGGPEYVYRLTVNRPTRLRARVYGDDGVDVDLHLLGAPQADRCQVRADKTLDAAVAPGTHYLVADTYVNAGQPLAGPYRLTVVDLGP